MSQRFSRSSWGRAFALLLVVVFFASPLRPAQQATAQEVTPTTTPTATVPLHIRAGHTTVSRELEIARKKLSANPTVTPTVTPTATPKQAVVAATPTATSVAQAAQSNSAPLVERDVRPDEWGGRIPDYWNHWGIGPVDDQIPSYWNSGWSHTYQNPYEGTRACISGPSTNGDFSMGQSGTIPTESQWMTLIIWIRIEHPQGPGSGQTFLQARLRTPSGVLATYRVATSQSLVPSWSLVTIVVEESVLSAIRGRAVSLDLVVYAREQGNLTRFVVDHWGAMVGGNQDPTSTPTPTATPTSTPFPDTNNAGQILLSKMSGEQYHQYLGEIPGGGGESSGQVIELRKIQPSYELTATIRSLIQVSKERGFSGAPMLANPAEGWFRYASVCDTCTGSENINARLVPGGNSGIYAIQPRQFDLAASILEWSRANGVPNAPRKIEMSLNLYSSPDGCIPLTIALTNTSGGILQVGSTTVCTHFQWQRFRMNLDPVTPAVYGVFVQAGPGDLRFDGIEGDYYDPRIGVVNFIPANGGKNLCPNGYSIYTSPGSETGAEAADSLWLEEDDIVYPGSLRAVRNHLLEPGQRVCRLAEQEVTYAVGGMGRFRIDYRAAIAGAGTLAIPRSMITGATMVVGTTGTSTTGLMPIGTLTGLGIGTATLLGTGAAVYGYAVNHGYQSMAGVIDMAQLVTPWADTDDGSGPYALSVRYREPVAYVWYMDGTVDSHPTNQIEKFMFGGRDEMAVDILSQAAPGAIGPIYYPEAVGIVMQRSVQIPEALGGTHPRSGHAAIHPGGEVYEVKRGGIWVKTNNQCKSNPETCKCWQRTSDSVILMFAEGARILYNTGGTIGNIGIVILRKADLVIGLNDDFISTALGNIRFDEANKPIGFSNLGPNDVNRVNCPNIFGHRDNWPHDSSGLLPG